MAATKYPITIEAKATFSMAVQCLDSLGAPVSLTGFTAQAEVKATATSTDVLATFTCTIPTPANGIINISMSKTETAKLNAVTAAVYDLIVTEADTVTVDRILYGPVKVMPGVTP